MFGIDLWTNVAVAIFLRNGTGILRFNIQWFIININFFFFVLLRFLVCWLSKKLRLNKYDCSFRTMSSVKVAVRVRPLNSREIGMHAKTIIAMADKTTSKFITIIILPFFFLFYLFILFIYFFSLRSLFCQFFIAKLWVLMKGVLIWVKTEIFGVIYKCVIYSFCFCFFIAKSKNFSIKGCHIDFSAK